MKEQKLFPIFTPEKELAMVAQQTDAYMQWAANHKGNEHNLKILLQDSPYFTSKSAVSSIRLELEKGRAIKNKEVSSKESDFSNRLLFLNFAKLSDAQHEQIDLELNQLDNNQKDLFSTLKGIDSHDLEPESDDDQRSDSDPGVYMTKERIESWLNYCRQLEQIDVNDSSVIFVTTSPAVFDYLISISDDYVNALDMEYIKVHENGCEDKKQWLKTLEKSFELALQAGSIKENEITEASDSCKLSGQLKLVFLSGSDIKETFNISSKNIPLCLVTLK
ncbi:MAG: hypothetical protein GY729_21655 [Desulfobacteraceae bacterium]|nr:hypothetical protein [Desulfobacteraceae bacterium]